MPVGIARQAVPIPIKIFVPEQRLLIATLLPRLVVILVRREHIMLTVLVIPLGCLFPMFIVARGLKSAELVRPVHIVAAALNIVVRPVNIILVVVAQVPRLARIARPVIIVMGLPIIIIIPAPPMSVINILIIKIL